MWIMLVYPHNFVEKQEKKDTKTDIYTPVYILFYKTKDLEY